jgi:hypothetical protein
MVADYGAAGRIGLNLVANIRCCGQGTHAEKKCYASQPAPLRSFDMTFCQGTKDK